MFYSEGHNQYEQQAGEPMRDLPWVDHLVISNPHGVMKVLAGHGYIGYLAPQDEQEMIEVAYELIHKHGDQAVIDLLKAHPLFDVISGICKEETVIKVPFKNAAGENSFVTTIRTINYKKLAENILIIVGIFFVADKFFNYLTKSE